MNLISVVFPVYNNLDVIKVTLPAINSTRAST